MRFLAPFYTLGPTVNLGHIQKGKQWKRFCQHEDQVWQVSAYSSILSMLTLNLNWKPSQRIKCNNSWSLDLSSILNWDLKNIIYMEKHFEHIIVSRMNVLNQAVWCKHGLWEVRQKDPCILTTLLGSLKSMEFQTRHPNLKALIDQYFSDRSYAWMENDDDDDDDDDNNNNNNGNRWSIQCKPTSCFGSVQKHEISECYKRNICE